MGPCCQATAACSAYALLRMPQCMPHFALDRALTKRNNRQSRFRMATYPTIPRPRKRPLPRTSLRRRVWSYTAHRQHITRHTHAFARFLAHPPSHLSVSNTGDCTPSPCRRTHHLRDSSLRTCSTIRSYPRLSLLPSTECTSSMRRPCLWPVRGNRAGVRCRVLSRRRAQRKACIGQR